METIAKKLEYNGEYYEFSHAKKNILTYIKQPYYKYDDWYEDGGIIVVMYRPNVGGSHKYLVLHKFCIYMRNAEIVPINISKQNKIANPVND